MKRMNIIFFFLFLNLASHFSHANGLPYFQFSELATEETAVTKEQAFASALRQSPFPQCQDKLYIEPDEVKSMNSIYNLAVGQCGLKIETIPEASFVDSFQADIKGGEEMLRFLEALGMTAHKHLENNIKINNHLLSCLPAITPTGSRHALTSKEEKKAFDPSCNDLLSRYRGYYQDLRKKLRAELILACVEFKPKGISRGPQPEFLLWKNGVAPTFRKSCSALSEVVPEIEDFSQTEIQAAMDQLNALKAQNPKVLEATGPLNSFREEHTLEFMRLLQQLPAFAYEGRENPTDAQLATAIKKLNNNAIAEKESIEGALEDSKKLSKGGSLPVLSGNNVQISALKDFIKYAPVINEMLDEPAGAAKWCGSATAATAFVQNSEVKGMVALGALAIAVPGGVAIGGARLAAAGAIRMSASAMGAWSATPFSAYFYAKDFQNRSDAEQRALTAAGGEGAKTIADPNEIQATQEALELSLLLAATGMDLYGTGAITAAFGVGKVATRNAERAIVTNLKKVPELAKKSDEELLQLNKNMRIKPNDPPMPLATAKYKAVMLVDALKNSKSEATKLEIIKEIGKFKIDKKSLAKASEQEYRSIEKVVFALRDVLQSSSASDALKEAAIDAMAKYGSSVGPGAYRLTAEIMNEVYKNANYKDPSIVAHFNETLRRRAYDELRLADKAALKGEFSAAVDNEYVLSQARQPFKNIGQWRLQNEAVPEILKKIVVRLENGGMDAQTSEALRDTLFKYAVGAEPKVVEAFETFLKSLPSGVLKEDSVKKFIEPMLVAIAGEPGIAAKQGWSKLSSMSAGRTLLRQRVPALKKLTDEELKAFFGHAAPAVNSVAYKEAKKGIYETAREVGNMKGRFYFAHERGEDIAEDVFTIKKLGGLKIPLENASSPAQLADVEKTLNYAADSFLQIARDPHPNPKILEEATEALMKFVRTNTNNFTHPSTQSLVAKLEELNKLNVSLKPELRQKLTADIQEALGKLKNSPQRSLANESLPSEWRGIISTMNLDPNTAGQLEDLLAKHILGSEFAKEPARVTDLLHKLSNVKLNSRIVELYVEPTLNMLGEGKALLGDNSISFLLGRMTVENPKVYQGFLSIYRDAWRAAALNPSLKPRQAIEKGLEATLERNAKYKALTPDEQNDIIRGSVSCL